MLKSRILSALVLAPPALAAIWWGGYAFAVVAAIAGAIMAWEWETVSKGGFGAAGILTGGAVFMAALLAQEHADIALLIVGTAALVVGIMGLVGSGAVAAGWQTVGALYVGMPTVSLVWLRADPELGRAAMVWLFLIVWATDIGAYAFGRTIGGPLLAPRISPNKTWAGLLGGMACACVVGAVLAWLFEPAWTGYIGGLSLLLALVAQLGDLAESRFKRQFGVKDTSRIIPGHGGVLDRLDGLVAAGLVLAILHRALGGAAAF